MSESTDRKKILYLDDEDVNLFIFDEFFKDHFEVVTTLSVEEALEMLRNPEVGIRLVITDLKMHPVGGMAFIQRVRSEGMNVPICVLTAFPKTQEISAALSGGTISAFFNKPFDPDLILRTVDALTQS